MLKVILSLILFLVPSLMFLPPPAFGETLILTNNDHTDGDPQIHKGHVVWSGGVDSNDSDYDIFYWDGNNVQNISNRIGGDFSPQIHNGQVVWEGHTFPNNQIYYWDGSEVKNISNSDGNCRAPQIHDGQVVWSGDVGNNSEIFFWDGNPLHSPLQLTDNDWDDEYPQIHDGKVVWEGYDYYEVVWTGYEYINWWKADIYYWDGNPTHHPLQIDDNLHEDRLPQIHKGKVVWGGEEEIFFWDGNPSHEAFILEKGHGPKIYDGLVVWVGNDGNDTEIFLWNGHEVHNISNNGDNDSRPQIHNGQVVWEHYPEIFLWDGSAVKNISNNNLTNLHPQIHNGQVVWQGSPGGFSSREIYYWKPDCPAFIPGPDACTDPNCPCGEGQGDCDSDAECEPGLVCVHNVGADYGWPWSRDVCEQPGGCPPFIPGPDACTDPNCPCGEGQGDCDSDAECEPGLVCVHNVGADYGWPWSRDVCEQPAEPSNCILASKFGTGSAGVSEYLYTDRTYTITGGVPYWMLGRTLIRTPNDERKNNSASGYIRFTTPVSWWVYILFDSRSTSIPNWLSGWERYTKYPDIKTSLATQPGLKMYRKMFNAGQCVDLGGNYGPGSSNEYRSNYVVVYGN